MTRGLRCAGDGSHYSQDGWCADSITVKNTIITTRLNEDTESDCMYFQDAANIILDNNYLHCQNTSPVNNHSDVIQSHRTRGWRITNNICIEDSNAQGAALIIGCWDLRDDSEVDSVIIYNNYFFMGGLWRVGAPWVNAGYMGWNGDYGDYGNYSPTIIIHNTFVTNGPYVSGFFAEAPVHLFVNNIVAQWGDGLNYGDYWLRTLRTSGYDTDFGIPYAYFQVDSARNNLLWAEWWANGLRVYGSIQGNGNTSSCASWSTWVNTYGGTGVSANPLFVDQVGHMESEADLDGELQSGSPAINAGEDIQAIIEGMGLPWTDINGNARDSTPDIGAYQYVP